MIEEHFSRLGRWIELESAAELARLQDRRSRVDPVDAERSGETLIDLALEDHQIGLGGRYLLTLVKRNRDRVLPWNRLRVGTPVVLSDADDDGPGWPGVVSNRKRAMIQVAVEDWPEGSRFRVDLSPDEITRRRQLAAIQTVAHAAGRIAQLRETMLGDRPPRFHREREIEFITRLNPRQQEAVRFALSADDIAVIHGPPGTGKTTTVVELIAQAVREERTVLATAPSNTAVDNLLERLIGMGIRVVRLGHPARVSAPLRAHTLDLLVENHDYMRVAREMTNEADQLFRKLNRYTRARPARGERGGMRREAIDLKKQARALERQAVQHVLDTAEVVCSTTTMDDELLGTRRFDLTIVDEACQSTEPGTWIPALRSECIVFAGDHQQLPPTVLSTEAAREGYSYSMLERLVDKFGPAIYRRLDIQYRMHQAIMSFSSDQFYDGGLIADPSVASHLLSDLEPVESNPLTTSPITFIDTAGAGWEEEVEPDGESRRNLSEARLILSKVRTLHEMGVAYGDMGVIAPYAAQVRWLRQQSDDDDLEIDTVDGFQGREKEVVLISTVRSNNTGEIGFLADTRRMNVALTRARRKLVVVGDSATLGGHEFFADLLAYFELIGAYHTVWEEDVDAY